MVVVLLNQKNKFQIVPKGRDDFTMLAHGLLWIISFYFMHRKCTAYFRQLKTKRVENVGLVRTFYFIYSIAILRTSLYNKSV